MLKIYLIRHGQDHDNAQKILNGRRNTLLTVKGIQQAKEIAKKIKNSKIHFEYVYSSPLRRGYKTAEIITNILHIKKPKILRTLIERDFGIMTGKPQKMIKKLCSPDILKTNKICYFLNPKGAETFPALIKRSKIILSLLKNKHKDGNILLVTHGDIGKMIYATYYHLNWREVLKMFHFDNTELLELSRTSSSKNTHVFKTK